MNLPIRYVSITTVPKEYTPHPVLPENQEVDMGTLLSAISSAKSQVSALSPYLFVLFETEKGGAFWLSYRQFFLGLLHGWFLIRLAVSAVHRGRKLFARRFPGYASLPSK